MLTYIIYTYKNCKKEQKHDFFLKKLCIEIFYYVFQFFSGSFKYKHNLA